ncbi:hypothetical protein FPS14_contig00105-0003 [Flavobacterium psychrophilum]|nr:hypothetical protein FPS14_contig00105-0003 [Flavobacterium psychrophilum]
MVKTNINYKTNIMKRIDFIEKYFTNNFYCINKDNFKKLQEIAIEMNCVNPNGDKSIIDLHDGFKNLGIRTKNGIAKFQKECFLLHNEKTTDYDEMISSYEDLIKSCY